MTDRGKILKAIHGEMLERHVYAPRLGLWHMVNSWAGTLPPALKRALPIR